MSIFYDQNEYEFSTPQEMGNLLAEMPFDLIKESIIEQIKDPITTKTNYLDVIIDKAELFRSQYGNDEDSINQLNERMQEFFISITEQINDKFDLGLDINEIASYSNMIEIGEAIYKYFILRYTKNITRFITKYIFKNKKELTSPYTDKIKKDVSTLAFKKQIRDPEDLLIITNLPSIIKYILEQDIDSDEFVNLSAGDGNFEASVVHELIQSNQLIGDFFNSYIKLCVDDHDYIIDELQTDIRIKIINKIS